MNPPPVALSIAGSDCSGGAGLQADLKTFQHFGVFGLTAVTCVVAETPRTVRSIEAVPPAILQDQVELLLDSFPVAAVKTGMLFSKAHIVAVSEILARHPGIPLVVDPVMVASTGDPLLQPDAVAAYRERLFPLATLLTPNLDEAAELAGEPIGDEAQLESVARRLADGFRCGVLLKGGHLPGNTCSDCLAGPDGARWFRGPRLDTPASHGTGCTLSAAITAMLALDEPLPEAVEAARDFLTEALVDSFQWGGIAALNQGTRLEREL